MLFQNLNSTEAYFIVQPGTGHSWAWNGFGSTDGEKLLCSRMAKVMKTDSCDVVDEQTESEDLVNALGGRTEYASFRELNVAAGFDPRLFFFSIAGGYNHFKELPNFVQDDLSNENIMVMDAYSTIWVWVGKKSSGHEQKNVSKRIDTYINALTDGRNPSNIQISYITPCSEPF